jgi:DNA-binding transcriptional LysR family regulator
MRLMHSSIPKTGDRRDRRPTFRELEALHALIEARKTTSAASKLGVSQPAVSRAIQQLEQRVGKSLFRREGGRLSPTPDGVQLYQQSLPIFEALAGLGRAPDEREARPILMIAPPTVAHRFLPALIAAFRAADPSVRMQIEVGTTSDVISQVADGRFDLGITDGQVNHPALAFEPFRRASAHAIIRRDHPLAEREEIGPQDLHGEPFIALTRRFLVRGTLDRLFLDAGAKPVVTMEAATSAIAYELVRSGLGITIINPFPVSLRRDADVAIRPFTPRASFETCFVTPSAAPPPAHARRFMDFLKTHQPEDGYSVPVR